MKKIGILFGMERSFPYALIEEINKKALKDISAEIVSVDIVKQGELYDYAVILDRISHDVPFYRSYLKNAALMGTSVMNNPFWWSLDEKFLNNTIALQVGVPIPKTVLLPSNVRPASTSEKSFMNMKYPLSWQEIFDYTGFPAFMKPYDGGGWKDVYKVHSIDDFFDKYNQTGNLVMMLQESIEFDDYYRCYCIGGKDVHIMQYEPNNPAHLRYVTDKAPGSKKLLAEIKKYTLALNSALGYDLNTVEFAVRDGIPIAIDFCNPAPDADINSVGQENFDWVVNAVSKMLIARAKTYKQGKVNLSWGSVLKNAMAE